MPMRYRNQTNWALPKPSRQSVHNLITPSDEVAKRQAGLFGLSDNLKRLSAYGDSLEELGRIIDFEAFRPTLRAARSEEHTSELQSLMRISYAVFCLKKKTK